MNKLAYILKSENNFTVFTVLLIDIFLVLTIWMDLLAFTKPTMFFSLQ